MAMRWTARLLLAVLTPCFAAACGDDDVDADADGGEPIPNEWGFDIRYPDDDRLPCTEPGEITTEWPDADWICSFSYDGVDAVVYVQATPVRCEDFMGPVLETRVGQVWVDGVVSPLGDTAYDWGGNHHNDSLEFAFGGRRYLAYHSSIGFGWRACHPMDCLQVSDATGTMLEDGCTCDRTVPAVCVQVRSDGTWDELVDTFAVCPGDSTCGA
ncbi:MAG: hypothetical protein JXB32_21475 [Deltaproteobacteria bacterium]|nr:hypothetical protein [Deltaproteobacteria bacterium]